MTRAWRNFSLILGSALPFLMASSAQAADFHDTKLPSAVTTGTEGAAGYSVSTSFQSTSKTSWTTVTGTTLSFTQGAAGCVEVSFTGEAGTVPGDNMLVRVLLDGSTVCTPTNNLFGAEGNSDNPADRAMNYFCPSVSKGAHTVKVQFASRFGAKVGLDYRTTIVRYAP
jgi:opacity protein-like surface antigen